MTTSLLRDEQSLEYDRRIRLAVLVALLLHAPVFLPSGVWQIGMGPASDSTEPSLVVRIEPPEPAQPKVDTPQEQPAQEAVGQDVAPQEAVPRETLPQEAERLAGTRADAPGDSGVSREGQLVVNDERDAVAEPQQLEGPHAPTEDESPAAVDSRFAEAAGADDTPDELPAPAPDVADESTPATEAVVATIAPAQERVLTRRLEREARELLESSAPQRRLTFEQDDREYTAVLKRQPAADGTGIERVIVEIATQQDGERVQTSLQMRRLAFSHFTQLVDHWDPMVQLHDDVIAGRFHSNNEIQLTYDRKVAPQLLGKVTTARHVRISNEEGWRSRRDIFAGGVQTRTPRIRLPEISLPVAQEQATRNADVHVVRGNALIIFYADGSYTCLDLASRTQEKRQIAAGRSTYIVGTRDAEMHVRGIVNGGVTVYSPKRIVVRGNLTYAHALRGGDADDFLGLVSDGNVEIDHAAVTGPGDLEIYAAIYARARFVVRNTSARGGATLIIHGSLTAGSLSETEPRYATRLEFDPRFERVRPPGFPETDRYEIETWDGRWRTSEAPTG